MRTMLALHITAGGLGLLFGYVALYASKGATLHRQSGMLFVYVMVTMALSGMLLSAIGGAAPAINIPAALVTFYMVVTSLLTVRPLTAGGRVVDVAAMLLAFGIAVSAVPLGATLIATGGPQAPMAYPLFVFGGIAAGAGLGDLRMIRAGGVRGRARLRRHLWRMSVALLIAAASFFLGQADEFPRALRIGLVLAAPVLAVLVTMVYWLWRVRAQHGSALHADASRSRAGHLRVPYESVSRAH